MKKVEIEKVLVGDYVTQICRPREDGSWEGDVMKVIAVDDPFIVVDVYAEDIMRICSCGPIRKSFNTRKTELAHISQAYMDGLNFTKPEPEE